MTQNCWKQCLVRDFGTATLINRGHRNQTALIMDGSNSGGEGKKLETCPPPPENGYYSPSTANHA